MPKKVKPISKNTKDYSLKLNYNVEKDIKPKRINEKEIFEMMGGKKNKKKKNKY
jgi:hypothetical protein